MTMHYDIRDVRDLWNMSWRRFTVLFRGIFKWDDEIKSPAADLSLFASAPKQEKSPMYEQAVKEAAGADSSIARSINWEAAYGGVPIENKETVTVGEFMKRAKKKPDG